VAERRDPARCLIDGELVTASGDQVDVVDPWTEQVWGSTPEAGLETVDRAVRSSADAFRRWSSTDVEERALLLESVAALLDRDAERLARLVTDEMGMPISLSRVTQAQLPAAVLRSTAEVARRFPWREQAEGAVLLRSGAGVVGAITPWNMPVHQIIAKVAAAVAAGSTVVLKASEQTPYDALLVAELFVEAGAPAGLLNVVTGTGPVTGSALASHPALARVSFTGSVRAGKEVARLAADHLTRCALELGGKSPALLLPDVDLDVAVPAVVSSGLVNSGQACNATTRILVEETRLDEVLPRIAAAAEALVLGDPGLDSTQQGPLVTARQRDAVLDRINQAVADGGQLLTGTGKRSDRSDTGFFVDPTVVVGLPEDARAVREEIFGPVVVVQAYRDVDDAVRIANDSDYGLSAEVWSADQDRALHVAGRLSVGQVKINGVRTRNRPAVPFGGVRQSGYGRELGPLGVEEFTEVMAVMA
jgi:acyl-CoA reductase-like NAD-dependent aldehyde dehydrogenase